jgi:hypothetical protein
MYSLIMPIFGRKDAFPPYSSKTGTYLHQPSVFVPFVEPFVVNPLPMAIDLVIHMSKENANFNCLKVSTDTSRDYTG